MGFIDELEKMNRRVARERQREYKTYLEEEKRLEKERELQEAIKQSNAFQNKIRNMLSYHTRSIGYAPLVDWDAILRSVVPEPVYPNKPQLNTIKSDKYTKRLENFKPNVFHKLFKQEDKSKERLKRKIKKQTAKEEKIFQEQTATYQSDCKAIKERYELDKKELAKNQARARKVITKDISAYKEALGYLQTEYFDYIEGETKLEKDFIESGYSIPGLSNVPKEEKYLGKSGNLLTKEMSKRNRLLLHRDFIVSILFFIANQIFTILPLEKNQINLFDMVLNKKTGYMENKCVLSVLFVKKTYDSLLISNIEPFEALDNFVHNVDFSDRNGFSPVEKIIAKEIE